MVKKRNFAKNFKRALTMAVILHIDTSTNVCSTALTSDGMILCHREDFQGQNHAALLSGFIKDCLDHARDHEMQLNAVAVSMGPGSYTGLRIGLSEAKGLAYALDVPLIGVDTLELMVSHVMFDFSLELPENVLYAPMIDARRMEVFTGVYDLTLTPLLAPQPLILDENSYGQFLADNTVAFFGNGSQKWQPVCQHPNAIFVPDVVPLASDMTALAERAYSRGEFLDIAYSTPRYLKEFQASKPKSVFGTH